MALTARAAGGPAAQTRGGRGTGGALFLAPSVIALFIWMIVPLAMTLYYSFENYNLLDPTLRGFAGLDNYRFLLTDPALWRAMLNTLILVGAVLAISVGFGTVLAVLFDQPFLGRGIARVLIISPFFVMPTVSALVWKNLLMHPIYGVLSAAFRAVGLTPVDWFADVPLLSLIIIVAWQWLPFALLILLTAIQSLDHEQREAARMDGAGLFALFFYIILPHLRRAIGVVVMIETIFLLTVFAEIFVTTSGGPGDATTNLAFLIYLRALLQFDEGGASAAGIIAVILANIVAVFLVRSVARNLDS